MNTAEALIIAVARLEDILQDDDGQAWKEAAKALSQLQQTVANAQQIQPVTLTLTDEVPAHVAGLLEHRRELDAIEFFESANRDSHGFRRSVRGTYVNPAVARDWKWFQLGMQHATKE